MKPLWPTQERSITAVHEATMDKCRRILLTSPTGSGKTRVACELIRDWLNMGYRTVVYTNRKSLVEQLSEVLAAFGLSHGVRAADWEPDASLPLQIASLQTEQTRARRNGWKTFDATRVIVDEAHLNKGAKTEAILTKHIEQGATLLGLTATPLDLGGIYETLIVGALPSELRKIGAIVPCWHYGPTEPDTSKVYKAPWEFTERDTIDVMQVQHIFGNIFEWYRKLNPTMKPSICFAPGVEESIWLAEQFLIEGVRSAHIDGEHIWLDGKLSRTTRDRRKDIFAQLRQGKIKVLCNRFVAREGIDLPEVEHVILATVFGSLQSYIQSMGRGLRSCANKSKLICQDHGGNYHRHGSINADRRWELGYTEKTVQSLRIEEMRKTNAGEQDGQKEPFLCPKCKLVLAGPKCPCGFEFQGYKRTRIVVMSDGTLKQHEGDLYKPRVTTSKPDTLKLWTDMYWRAVKGGKPMTFNQCRGLFLHENGYLPPENLPYMPTSAAEWNSVVKNVPKDRLYPPPPKKPRQEVEPETQQELFA